MYTKLNWKSFLSLKVPVIVAFVVLWNAGFLYAMYMGGGGLAGGLTPIGMKITGYVCAAASLFSFSIAAIKPFRNMLLAKTRVHNFSVKEFYFLAFVAGLLAISRFVFPILGKQ